MIPVSTITNLIKLLKVDVYHFMENSSTSDGQLKKIFVVSQLTFTCSNSTTEILEKGVKYVQS